MDEDEYDRLPEEERQRIDQKRLQRKKDRILKYDHVSHITFFFSMDSSYFSESSKLKKKKFD